MRNEKYRYYKCFIISVFDYKHTKISIRRYLWAIVAAKRKRNSKSRVKNINNNR